MGAVEGGEEEPEALYVLYHHNQPSVLKSVREKHSSMEVLVVSIANCSGQMRGELRLVTRDSQPENSSRAPAPRSCQRRMESRVGRVVRVRRDPPASLPDIPSIEDITLQR